jgi:hypothetical protein
MIKMFKHNLIIEHAPVSRVDTYVLINTSSIIKDIVKTVLQNTVNRYESIKTRIKYNNTLTGCSLVFNPSERLELIDGELFTIINEIKVLVKHTFCIDTSYEEWVQLRSVERQGNSIISTFLNDVEISLIKFRYLFRKISDPTLEYHSPITPPSKLCSVKLLQTTEVNYIISILYGIFSNLVDENKMHKLMGFNIKEGAFIFFYKYMVGKNTHHIAIQYHKNTFSLNFQSGFTYNPIRIIYDETTSKLYPLFEYSIRFVNMENADNFDLPSLNPIKDNIYIDDPEQFRHILHFFRIFTIAVNRYHFLFEYDNKVDKVLPDIDSIFENIDTLIINSQIECDEPIPASVTLVEKCFKSTAQTTLQEFRIYCKKYNSSIITRIDEDKLIICRNNDIIHMSIFKTLLTQGQFHFTNDFARRLHLHFTVPFDLEYNFKKEGIDTLCGKPSMYITEKAKLKVDTRKEEVLKSISFYYKLLTEFIFDNKKLFI